MKLKGPALAGLFFVLTSPFWAQSPAAARLSAAGQVYFRQFVERFTPLVVQNDRGRGPGNRGNYRWDKTNRDCAGLVRYVYREALTEHGVAFFDRYPTLNGISRPQNTGELKRALFAWQNRNNTARDMITHSVFIGRVTDQGSLKTGDLLYFESSELKIRHVMLVVRAAADIFLVYHTGDDRDELRIRTLADIRGLPESQWHPDTANPVFRGIYRPTFLQ